MSERISSCSLRDAFGAVQSRAFGGWGFKAAPKTLCKQSWAALLVVAVASVSVQAEGKVQ